jgi:hypothetical protein
VAKKHIFCIVLIASIVLSGTPSVFAQGPIEVYVDEGYAGNEEGTQNQPYNTIKEGEGRAHASDYGGYVYVRQSDGSWKDLGYYPAVESGRQGIPLPRLTLDALLAVLALALMLVGWQFLRRARRFEGVTQGR